VHLTEGSENAPKHVFQDPIINESLPPPQTPFLVGRETPAPHTQMPSLHLFALGPQKS